MVSHPRPLIEVLAEILGFRHQLAEETRTVAETVDGGHGRIEQRRLQTSDVLVECSDWPGLAQVCQLERPVNSKTSFKDQTTVKNMISLPACGNAPHGYSTTSMILPTLRFSSI